MWVTFWILFFPSILERNGHAIDLPSFLSFCLVEIDLQLCNSKQLQAYRFSRNYWKLAFRRAKKNQHWYLLLQTQRMSRKFFFVFPQSLLKWEKKSTYYGNQVKKRNHAMTANLFNVILPEKDQWHILTFGPKTERVSRCWSLMWKKSPQKYWHITNPKLQHFFVLMWKMMDIVASRKCWILVQRRSKCLNSLLESIYF